LNPDTVAHLSTNRARRRLTSLIEANALTTTPDHQSTCTSIQVVQKKNLAQSLMHDHFATVCRRITRFAPQCSLLSKDHSPSINAKCLSV